ncbi:hypothetical protein Tco_1094874 [Tanacetum coccineum]
MDSLGGKHNIKSVVNPNLVTPRVVTASTPSMNVNSNNTKVGPALFATLLKGDTSQKWVNFLTLVTLAGNGVDIVVSKESVFVLNEQLSNIISSDWMKSMLENGSWLIHKGMTSYARAMVKLQVNVELKDITVVHLPRFVGEGYTMRTFVLSMCGHLLDVQVIRFLVMS